MIALESRQMPEAEARHMQFIMTDTFDGPLLDYSSALDFDVKYFEEVLRRYRLAGAPDNNPRVVEIQLRLEYTKAIQAHAHMEIAAGIRRTVRADNPYSRGVANGRTVVTRGSSA